MLDEVRGAGLGVGLVPRAGADPEAEGDRADIRDPLRDDSLARVELGEDVFLHPRIIPAGRDGRLPWAGLPGYPTQNGFPSGSRRIVKVRFAPSFVSTTDAPARSRRSTAASRSPVPKSRWIG